MQFIPHLRPQNKIKILDYTYTSEPSINTALPLILSKIKLALFIIGCIISFGFLWLFVHWSHKKKALILYSVCSAHEASSFLVEEEDVVGGQQIVSRGNLYDIKRRVEAISFVYHERMYLYHDEKEVFLPIRYEDLGHQLDKLKKNTYRPYTSTKRLKLRQYYGDNVIKLEVQSKIEVFLQEMLTPYEVFQTYAIILWIYQKYYIFSFLLLAYSLFTYYQSSAQVTKNQQKLADQSFFDIPCKVFVEKERIYIEGDGQNSEDMSIAENQIIQKTQEENMENPLNEEKFNSMSEEISPQMSRKGSIPGFRQSITSGVFSKKNTDTEIKEISSQQIVPGDIIFLQEGDIVPCDAILLTGNILVDESYASGENYLIRKRPVQNYIYVKEKQKSFLLYMGTKIVKVRNKFDHMHDSFMQTYLDKQPNIGKVVREKQIACLVTQTNYNTLRGKYLRAIRYQKKQQENFTRETIYFIYILIFITTIGFLAILPTISEAQTGWSLFITYLDLLSDSIPMTLPTALSVGIKFAQHRLRKHNIDLVLPSNILAGGRANSIVLDSCKAFGKDYEVESIMVGTKNKRGFGNTYTSMTDFLQISHNTLTASMVPSEIERQEVNEIGKRLFQALTCCHTLQTYKKQVTGNREQKKLYQFARGSFIGEDIYECFHEKICIQDRIYFKEKDQKFGVLVELSEKDHVHSIKEENVLDFSGEMEKMESIENVSDGEISQKVDDSKRKMIFVKGPPEMILKVCIEETYPENSYEYIVDMAEKGFKLVCYACKQIEELNNIKKFTFLKEGFTFLGFAILQQEKKEDTPQAMMQLKRGELHLMLVSELNELQTSSIAILNNICTKNQLLLCSRNKEKIMCRGHTEWTSSGEGNDLEEFIVESQDFIRNSSLSLSSDLYEELFMKNDEHGLDPVFRRSIIFSSMENRHSRNLYLQLEKRGYSSFAVGTGTNVAQCANLTLELERGECSLLSSFHTQQTSLLTISHCLRICRAALATNFHCFSMMIHFSLIQFTTVVILEYHYQCITDSQMLYEDLFVTFPIFVTINLTLPASKLSKELPPGSFFSLRVLVSMIGQFLIQFTSQFFFILFLFTFERFINEKDDAYKGYTAGNDFKETEVALAAFIMSNYLYLGIVLSTSVSKPFRKPFYTNIAYTITLVILWLYNTGMVIFPSITIDDVRKKNLHETTEYVLILALLVGNLVMMLMYLYENLLVWIWQISNHYQRRDRNEIEEMG